jgi:zinc/manganese transport system substrate-binding protein
MRWLRPAAIAALLVMMCPAARADGISIIAAENFYGDVARQIGGPEVEVTSILNNPNQDPHQFEASASTARAIADAGFVIYSGAAYDPWMASLLAASPRSDRKVIVVADLTHRKAGDNPHLWYDPATMPALARALAAALETADPAHKPDYEARLARFLGATAALERKIAQLRQQFSGTPVTATEPVFGYMAEALGLAMRNQSLQTALMNDTEPSARDVAAFEGDLRQRKVKVLFYNSQVTDDLTTRLRELARESGIPVVGIGETAPAGMAYQDWIAAELDATAKALAGPGS